MARDRFLISLFLALMIHLLIFLILQLTVKFEESRIPEYSGPLFVQIEDAPVILKPAVEVQPAPRAQIMPETREEAPPQPAPADKQAPADKPVPAESRLPAEPLRSADLPEEIWPEEFWTEEPIVPRATRPAESPLRTPLPIDEPAVEEQTGTVFGDQPQPGREVESEEPEESLLMPLDRLDQALTQAGDIPEYGESRPGDEGREEPLASSDSSRTSEGITIQWDNPAEGRETTSTPQPRIPHWVEREGLRLKVLVSFTLTPEGLLSMVKVEESSGYPDVDKAVLEALRLWKFKPVNSTRSVRGRVRYIISPY